MISLSKGSNKLTSFSFGIKDFVEILVILLFINTCHASRREEWNSFKKTYNKVYTNLTEEMHRMNVFFRNKIIVSKHNKKFRKGQTTFHLRMNHFGDMMFYEFKQVLIGMKVARLQRGDSEFVYKKIEKSEPTSVDWREKGAVTEVKSQGRCGSCWAFGTTGSLESQHFIKTGKLVSLSEQNLLDCSTIYGNDGCDGGYFVNSFKYIMDNEGISTEKFYPYEGKVGHCRFKKEQVGATAEGYKELPEGDEKALMNAVAFIGPVSTGIHAASPKFQFYGGGVFYDSMCNPDSVNHGLLVIGYGSENNSMHWLLKNSMSRRWGERGYMKSAKNMSNHCGIATLPCFPIV